MSKKKKEVSDKFKMQATLDEEQYRAVLATISKQGVIDLYIDTLKSIKSGRDK